MSKEIFKAKIECKSCGGTGLYIGLAEHDGAAVVCKRCKGTGCDYHEFEYTLFTKRRSTHKVKRVFETNPGFVIGNGKSKDGKEHELEDFGGMPYKEWLKDKPFPIKSEMRSLVCPAWWYQGADYDKKPEWEECRGCGAFSDCPSFKTKEKCWERFDKEQKI